MRKIIGVKMKKQKYIDEQTNKQTNKQKKQTRSILNHLEGPNMVPFFLTSSIIFLFSLLWLTLRFQEEKLDYWNKIWRPRRDSNPQSSDPKSDALSIRPRGQL